MNTQEDKMPSYEYDECTGETRIKGTWYSSLDAYIDELDHYSEMKSDYERDEQAELDYLQERSQEGPLCMSRRNNA